MQPLYERYNSLGDMLRGSAEQWASKPAVLFQGEPTSYALLERLSNQIANGLSARGVTRGDRVGLYCINAPWFVAAYFAIVKLGAWVVPINLLLNAEQVVYILSDAEAKALIYFEAFEPNVAAIRERLPRLETLIGIGELKLEGAESLRQLLTEAEPECEIPPLNPCEDVAAVLYTSGTTGQPKGAMLTHRNLLFNVESVTRALPLSADDVFLTVLPLFHSFGATACMLTPIALGATIVAVPRFTPEGVARAIAESKATIFMGVPSMYTIFANIPDDRRPDFSSLRFCVSGGAALPVEVMRRFEEKYHVPICEGDGPTECSPVTSVNPIEGERKPGTIGLPIPGVEMKIVDEEGQELPTGEIGEIVVRGENVMKGCLNRPEETTEVFFGEWYRTGDMGYVDEDGYFAIVDRKKDMIIVNGMNVYPRMVEEVIHRHPAVAEVAVVAEPHPLHGEIPRAVIALKPDMDASKEEILALCHQHLGRHEIPRIVEFVAELPKTPTGKILKRALTRRGEAERGVS